MKKAEFNIRGQSLVEILVSLGIFAIVTTAIFFLFFGGQSLSLDSSNQQIAIEYASEGLEAVSSVKNRDWDELVDGSHGLTFQGGQWQFSGTEDVKNIFTRSVFISTIDSNTKQASTTVTWQTDPLRQLSVELVEQLTNWSAPLFGGCSEETLTGDWTQPQTLGSADLGPGNEGTDVVVSLPYVFVSGEAASVNKPDIFVFDVTDPASPQLLNALNTGSDGINTLFLSGNYLYAASSNDDKELIIFNVASPPNISEIASLNLTGAKDALSIYGAEDTIYIGREEGGNEFVVVDVTILATPTVVTSFSVGDDINDIFASSQKLYLTSEESNNDLWIYDITSPQLPSLLNTYDLQQGGELVSVELILPGSVLVGDDSNEFFILGATTTSQVYVRDSLIIGGGVNDIICVADNLAFLATSNSNKEFLIVDISNLDNITETAFLGFPQVGTGIDFADNKIFMSVRSNDALRIITSSP